MGKPLVNTKQWTKNDIRMLIILQFILVYPILAGALFMVLLFFALPNDRFWHHAYWLIASGAWVLLLTIILPLMRNKHEYQPTGSHTDKKAHKPTDKKVKDNNPSEKIPHAHVSVEATKMDHNNRDSVLTNRSSNSSNDKSSNGIEKGTLDEKADKEDCEKLQGSLNNSKENVQKSMESDGTYDTLKNRRSLTHSGEFLNDCIGTFGDDNKKQDNADVPKYDNPKRDNAEDLDDDNKKQVYADVHKQKESRDADVHKQKESRDDDSDIEMINDDNKGIISEDDNEKPQSNTDDIERQILTSQEIPTAPLKPLRQEDITDDEEEIEELGEIPSLSQRRNIAHANVDTSLSNATYTEQSVSTPISASSLDRRNSNVVHLFIQ
ncbi:unnamed protein product [Meganyctiphanes norvegica]|uniref:Uncharacterized protein n=1 Tax=Meganyctiphanes norvegica TaxID=48144 RepID=A0AAV2QXB8_MEGNR